MPWAFHQAPAAALLVLAVGAAPGRAQALMLRDGLATDGQMVAYDGPRHRLVTVGRHGETRELDGTQWLMRPGQGPTLFGALAYRSAAARTLAFGYGYDYTAQTWEFDGGGWQRVAPATQPSLRERFAIAYDSLRDRVVVFGGSTAPADTWEWDGTTWLQRFVVTTPPTRFGAPLAYDPGRARIVMHGGLAFAPQFSVSDEVWEYDGTNWQLVGSGGPGARQRHDLVFDPDRGEVLAIGGWNNTAGNSDIWSWNGTQWTHVLAVPRQPVWGIGMRACAEPATGALLMYGGSTSRFLGGAWTEVATGSFPQPRLHTTMWSDGTSPWLFGGRDVSLSGPIYQDTFRWSGTAWVQSLTAARPAPRYRSAAAYDAVAGRAVLFGGVDAVTFGDTWTFDGASWQLMAPATAPPARHGHGMAFDPVRGRTVLFGGIGANGTYLRDTWEWNGAAWSAVNTAVQPPPYGTAAMAFDQQLLRTVMTHAQWSGSYVPSVVDVWTFDGAAWAQLPLAEPRRAATEHSLAVMPGTNRVFLVDGSSAQELVHTAPRADIVGSPCDAQAPHLCGRAFPEPGNAAFGIDVVRAAPLGAFLLGGSVQTANVPLGGCTLRLGAPLVVVAVGVANAAGFATRAIPVPPQPALVGAQLWFQAAVPQPLAATGVTLSPALRVVVGG